MFEMNTSNFGGLIFKGSELYSRTLGLSRQLIRAES
jgi:hypothetical protein